MPTQPTAYVERYLWNRRTKSLVIGGALSVAVSVGVAMPLVPTIVLFGGGMLVVLWGVLGRRVALRVDADGVTLGGSPMRYRATTTVVPWADIVAVVLWQQVLPAGTLMPYLGLQRRPGAAPLAGPPGRRGGTVPAGLVPDLPADVLMSGRAVNGWRLDRRGLARAVAVFAPDAWVLDHDSGRVVTENGG